MSEIKIGEPIPWKPINPSEFPIPGREDVPRRDIERAVPFPDDPDPETIAVLQSGGAGRNYGGQGRGNTPPDDDEPNKFGGTERYAFYRTFRCNDEKWGVFIYKASLAEITRRFSGWGAKPTEAQVAARYMLQNHETAHFLVDRAVLTLETTHALANACPLPDFWVRYRYSHPHYSHLEEAVCNAYAYRMARDNAKRHVKSFMESQPQGYCDVDFGARRNLGTSAGSFQQSESQLLSDYQVDRSREGISRVLGLNNLMQYNDPIRGVNGDLFMTTPRSGKQKLPVWLIR